MFAKFRAVFVTFSSFLVVVQSFHTCSDAFGRIRIRLDAFGCVRMRSDTFGFFGFLFDKFDDFGGF